MTTCKSITEISRAIVMDVIEIVFGQATQGWPMTCGVDSVKQFSTIDVPFRLRVQSC
jgi:hypothetical protein